MTAPSLSTDVGRPRPRPTSPHLTIFRPLITMVMSIVHRVTGAALYVGSLLLAWWLIAIALGPEAYETARDFFGSIVGRLVLFGYTWALLHHMFGGIRHLVWDTGAGFGRPERDRIAWATIIASVSLTLIVWVVGSFARG